MGTLRSEVPLSGLVVNGITLGQPSGSVDEDTGLTGAPYIYDDPRLPDGEIIVDIVIDPTEVPGV